MIVLRHCRNCFSLRQQVEDKQKYIVQLQEELNKTYAVGFEDMLQAERYFKENKNLTKKLNKAVKHLVELTNFIVTQEKTIKKLKKEKIQDLGKVLITFMFKQSADR